MITVGLIVIGLVMIFNGAPWAGAIILAIGILAALAKKA